MARRVQLVRHTTANADLFTGLQGEVTVDTTKSTMRVHDGTTRGGKEIAKADASNIQAASGSVAGKMTTTHVANLATALAVATAITNEGYDTPTDFVQAQRQTAVAQPANYALTGAHNGQFHELADGVVATLPTAASDLTERGDWEITLKAVGNTATVNRNSQSIDGEASNIDLVAGQAVTVVMNAAADGYRIKNSNASLRKGEKIINKGVVGNSASGETVQLDLAQANFFFLSMVDASWTAGGSVTLELVNEPDTADTHFTFYVTFRRGGRKTVVMPTGYDPAGGVTPAMGNTDDSYDVWMFYKEKHDTTRKRYMLVDSE